MSGLVLLALQKALYARLDGDSALSAAVSGIFDRVPEDADYPYVVIGDAESRDWSASDAVGADSRVVLHVYSRHGGRSEALNLMERLHSLLHDVVLSISGLACVMCRFVSADVDIEADGARYHGRMQLRIISEEV